MNDERQKFNSSWLMYVAAAVVVIAVFVLCFVAIDYVSQPDAPKELEVEEVVIATDQTNGPLLELAREQGWIDETATEMTSVDAAKVKILGNAFQSSRLERFDEFRYFVGVEEINADAFAHSESLRSITIPANVSSIEYGALADCPALTAISVDTANAHYDSRGDCNGIICTWKGALMLVAGCPTTTVPKNVRYIAPNAFQGSAVKNIVLPERLNEIGEKAFRNCTSLTEIDIPQGIRFVEEGTFDGCTALETVTLSKSIERLRKDAFKGCASLKSIVCLKKYPPIIENAFDIYQATVYVPKGMQNKYYADRYWKDFPRVEEKAQP
jgi:hypothetical protein